MPRRQAVAPEAVDNVHPAAEACAVHAFGAAGPRWTRAVTVSVAE